MKHAPKWTSVCLSVLVGACSVMPQDPAATSRRVRETGQFAVGFVDPAARDAPATRMLIAEMARRTRAQAKVVPGTGEALLMALDRGEVDVAVGWFDPESPWRVQAAFGPALTRRGYGKVSSELTAVMRNGENRWIMTVERASRAVSAEGHVR